MLTSFVGILGVAVMAVFGWAFQLNSKVSVQEQRQLDLHQLISVRFDAVDKRLERIERAMNGTLKGF